ncbi:MAG: DUF2341 domain-containing protein, partial [Verrucomicrobiota bacterium]
MFRIDRRISHIFFNTLFISGLVGPWPAHALDPSDFFFRQKISFTNYNRAEVLTNFPVLIRFDAASSEIHGGAVSSLGYDIRFTDASQSNEIPFELESWDPDGESIVWVRHPALASNRCIYAYWGNPADTNLPPYAVDGSTWSDGFVAVHHLSETGGLVADDATANNLNGNLGNMNGSEWTPGRVGNGLSFNGVNQFYDMADIGAFFGANAATMNVWVKLDLATPIDPARTGFMSLGTGSNNHYPWVDGLTYQNVWRNNARVEGIALLPSVDRTTWHQITITSETGGSGLWRMYQNGVEIRNVGGLAFLWRDCAICCVRRPCCV